MRPSLSRSPSDCNRKLLLPALGAAWCSGLVARGGFDALHVRVGEAKMMADLVDQHMGDEVAERLVAFRPVIEQRSAVEKYHIREARQVHDALLVEADAVIEPH